MLEMLQNTWVNSGFGQFQFGNVIMIGVGLLFIWLAVKKNFEPLLLIPIGFGILIGNIPYDTNQLSLGVYDGPRSTAEIHYYATDQPLLIGGEEVVQPWQPVPSELEYMANHWLREKAVVAVDHHNKYVVNDDDLPAEGESPIVEIGQGRSVFAHEHAEDGRYPEVLKVTQQDPWYASVFWLLFRGIEWGIYPPLIFLGVGALTDFGPLLANPKTLLLGAAAQFGIFGSLLGAMLLGFDGPESSSIGIIGGADGPTAIFVCSSLAPELLGAVALAAYSYMAMVPIIQPPIMKLLTTKEERKIRMEQLKPVPRSTRIIFPIAGFLLTAFIANGALPLLGMLFFGNLLRESLVTERLAKTAQTTFIDICTILLGVSVGAKTQASNFLTWDTIKIFILGIAAFSIATAAGVLFAKLMNKVSKHPVNPLIGAAGVSAVPMAARVAHKVGQEEDPHNYLLMHAMGPNVAGVIGSAVAAGVLLSLYK